MSLYKKPGSKFWWYAFTFKGTRIQKSTKVENRREAENIEKAAWTQFARGEVGPRGQTQSRTQDYRPASRCARNELQSPEERQPEEFESDIHGAEGPRRSIV